MNQVIRYLKFEHNSLSVHLKTSLAKLFQARHKEFSDMPSHQFNYYLSPLHSNLESEICKEYILAMRNEHLVGYASIEYRESQFNENSGTIVAQFLTYKKGLITVYITP